MTRANMSEPDTLRIPVDVLSDIEAIADATERSRSYIIVRAGGIGYMNGNGSPRKSTR
ncbi:CopG family ribbon-helix-helix protein [Rhizobium ruizarguesonis]|uniref:CopG family ribbon-helix-helix protein n=1 Tax=Rhizobium ruizarguesonis TaxID=2081791 RepID=UPI0018D4F8BD|nr:hypothetical protein [Rhizobium ruizarguesonis]